MSPAEMDHLMTYQLFLLESYIVLTRLRMLDSQGGGTIRYAYLCNTCLLYNDFDGQEH